MSEIGRSLAREEILLFCQRLVCRNVGVGAIFLGVHLQLYYAVLNILVAINVNETLEFNNQSMFSRYNC